MKKHWETLDAPGRRAAIGISLFLVGSILLVAKAFIGGYANGQTLAGIMTAATGVLMIRESFKEWNL